MLIDLNQYKIIVDIFKGYLDTALTGTIWVYAITGAVLTYYLSHRKENRYLIISLILPICLCGILAYVTLNGRYQADLLKNNVNKIGKDAGLPEDILIAEGVPPVTVLKTFLSAIGGLSLSIGALIFVLIGIDLSKRGRDGEELETDLDGSAKRLAVLALEKKRIELEYEIKTLKRNSEIELKQIPVLGEKSPQKDIDHSGRNV